MSEIDLMLDAIAECFCDHYCVARQKCKNQDELYEICSNKCPLTSLNHKYKVRLAAFEEEMKESNGMEVEK